MSVESGINCRDMAVALSRRFNWSLWAAFERAPDGDLTLVHAFAVSPSGTQYDEHGSITPPLADKSDFSGTFYPGEKTVIEIRPTTVEEIESIDNEDMIEEYIEQADAYITANKRLFTKKKKR